VGIRRRSRVCGLAPYVANLAEAGRFPSATLTVNRRQQHEVEREALAHYRHGEVAASHQLRDTAGLEHHAANPETARQAMAEAVVGAIGYHGSENIAALAVTHADCEDLADRVRTLRAQQGAITGPAIEGPGWSRPRTYQAGDRILLHSRIDLDDGRRLSNGMMATVMSVSAGGLAVRADGDQRAIPIPAEIVAGRRPDRRPHISHAWCRTIDGVQGGTWTETHLLGTAALDRYRGYVGQSRATLATHTWNTRALDPGDHGGRLARSTDSPAQEVQAAMERQPAKTFAAFDDPYRLAVRLERERAAHRAALANRPPDVSSQLKGAQRAVAVAGDDLTQAEQRVRSWHQELGNTSGWTRLRAGRRQRHDRAGQTVSDPQQGLEHYRNQLDQRQRELTRLEAKQRATQDFDHTHAWRYQRIADLDQRLDRHWTEVVVAAAQAGDPFAYGRDRLERAYRSLLHCRQASPNDALVERQVCDLERAVLTSGPAQRMERTPVDERASRVRQVGEWPELARNLQLERDPGHELGIGL
jgi:hypothetical protein